MSELIENAISGKDKKSFDQVRKLIACGVVLSDEMPPKEAAAHADKNIFQMITEYAVGRGEMAADAAVDAIIDRQCCVFSTFIHESIETCVTTACTSAGTIIGSLFGPVGAANGAKIGAVIAGFLNTNLSPLIDIGIAKIKDVAKSVWEEGKAMLKAGVDWLWDTIFG